MSKDKISTKSSLLRKNAEDLLLKKASESQETSPFTNFSEADLLKLVHELDVYKIELEMKLDETERIAAELKVANPELTFQKEEKAKRAAELTVANKELAFQNKEKEKRANELIIANEELIFQNEEKENRASELIVANQELDFQNEEKAKRAAELSIANKELVFQNREKEKRADELIIANKELIFQNEEKEKRAAELIIANQELAFQNEEKAKRAAELSIANKELVFQNREKEKRADELIIANKELIFQNDEKENRAVELIIANKELLFQNDEKEKRASELIVANKELAFQNEEKAKRAAELSIANKELAYENREKEKRADELIIANKELLFQNEEKENRASELIVANKELAFQNEEKAKRAAELRIANKELAHENREKEKRADELIIANKELAFQNEEKERRGAELIIANIELAFQNEEKIKRAAELLMANTEIAFQSELIMANAYLENLISYANGPIIIWDMQFCITRFNPAFELLTGRSKAEVLGNHLEILFPPALVEDSMANILKTLNGERWDAIELEILHRDSSVRTVLWNSSTLYSPDGQTPIATIAQGQDITDRKKLEEEVKLVSARLAMAAQSGGVGIWDYDFVNNILLWDIQMYALYGIREIDFSGVYQFWSEVLHPDDVDQCHQEIQLAIHGEKEFDTEFRVVWPDGSVHTIRALASIQHDNSGKAVRMIGTNWDISEQKSTELEINLQNEALQKVNSEKDKFFSIIAHDLRGPLGGFMGMTEMLTDESYQLTENDRKQMMANLRRSSRNTFTLLENLLEWAQMVQGLTEFKPQKLDLTQTIAECISALEESAKVKRIELIVQIVGEPILLADKNMLQSVVRNLISNAIKFTPNGGEISITAESSANNMTVISVKDTGIGMNGEMLNNLFRMDGSTNRPGTNGENSTGLGLLLCKEFVEKLGGKITVESEPNKGTVFSFNIPALMQEEKEVGFQKDAFKQRTDDEIENLNILIAEDDEITMKLISLLLKGISKQVYQARSGEEAVKICRENQDIDLVLMDIAMPLLDGYDATRQIREFNQTVIIIAETGFIFANNKEKALAAGFNDYITKPFIKSALIEIIKMHLKVKKSD